MKKTVFRLTLIVFVLLVFCWLFYTPRRPETMLYAIPDDAVLVTVHQDIADRYNALLDNPFAASLLNSAGVSVPDLREQMEQPSYARVIDFLLSGQVTLSYVPAGLRNRSDMWAFTDWLGGRTTVLQVVLNWGRVPYVAFHETYNAIPVYRMKNMSENSGIPLYFAVVEGGVIGCICPDPYGIRLMIDGYLAHNRTVVDQYEKLMDETMLSQAADRGWYRREDTDDCISFAVSRLCSNRFDVAIEFARTGSVSRAGTEHTISPSVRRLFGSLPSLVIETTTRGAADMIRKTIPRKGLPALAAAEEMLVDMPLTVGLFGDDEYSGRFNRMRFPLLVLAFSLPDEADTEALIATYIDRLNAVYRAGLVPRSVAVSGGRTVYVVEGTASGDYARKSFDERMAYTVISNQLIVGSSAQALIKLTARYDRTEAVDDMPNAVWPEIIEKQQPATAALWLDFVKGGKTIRLAIAAYAISLMGSSPDNTETARMLMADAEAWTASLEPMRQLVAAYRTGDHKGRVEIQAGE